MKLYGAIKPIGMGLALTIIVLCPAITHGDPLDQWHWRNPLPQGNELFSVAHGNGELVAVGRAGTILSSRDGATWAQRASGTVKSLKAVAFGAGIFVAVGYSGTILTSVDGETWSPQTSGVSVTLNAVTVTNEGFAVAGSGGTVLTSAGGMSWAIQSTGTADDLNGIAFGNGVFVAIGSAGYGSASNSYRSTDGVIWTITNSGLPSLQGGVSFGNGIFLAVSHLGAILTSSDGVAWTFRTPDRFITPPIDGISFSDGIFIAWGGISISGGQIATSPDGQTWTMRTQEPAPGTPLNELNPFNVRGVTSAGGTLVAVGAFGTVMTSSGGATWTQRHSDASFSGDSAMAVSFGSGTFVAVGSGGTISTSPDGTDWTQRLSRGSDFTYHGVTYGNGTFVAVGEEYGSSSPARKAIISTSPDGSTWTHLSLDNATSFGGVAYGNGLFIAVGSVSNDVSESGIFTSTDAVSWTRVASFPGSVLYGVHSANGLFVAVGLTWGPWGFLGQQATGLIATSSDGMNWNQTSTRFVLNGVTHGNGVFVAVGGGTGGGFGYTLGPVMASPDGVTWYEVGQTVIEGRPMVLRGIAFGNETFVAVGDNLNGDPSGEVAVIVTSQDGSNWIRRTSGAGVRPFGAAFGGGTFVAVGEGGAILQSDNVLKPCDPVIAINGSKGIVSMSATDTLSARINFKARSFSGMDADWWVVAGTPFGWFYYVYPDSWTYASDLGHIRPAHQGALFDLSTIQVLQIAGLPMGAYAFYFGIDTAMNGLIDFDRLHLDSVLVNMSH